MILRVSPVSKIKGSIALPASKSYSIRAFLIAACGGHSTIITPSDCDDAIVAMRTAQALGSRIQRSKNVFHVDVQPASTLPSVINVKESGTVLRLLLPLLALRNKKVTVTGEGTLKGRPNQFLCRTLRNMGVQIRGAGEKESIPICLNGGTLNPGKIGIDGSLSSQFVSALLISCPQLDRDSTLTIKGKMVSSDYITMTLQVLESAGIRIRQRSAQKFTIPGNQSFKGLKYFIVPSDYGLAAFFMVAGALLSSQLALKGNLKRDFIQADAHIIDILRKMNVKLSLSNSSIRIKGPAKIKGQVLSLKDCPDLVPIVTVLAMFAKGKTMIKDIAHARSKESDRISDLRKELLKVGAHIEERKDALVITPQKNYKKDQLLDPHHDHRLAMAFAILGLKVGVRVKDIECCRKSYPQFVRDLKSLDVERL